MRVSTWSIAVLAAVSVPALAGCGQEPLTPGTIAQQWSGLGARRDLAERLDESGALLGLSEEQARTLLADSTVEERHREGKNRVVTMLWVESGSGQPDSYWLRARFVNNRLVATKYGLPG